MKHTRETRTGKLAACRKALRQAAQAAARSEHILHTITDTALDSIFIKDRQRRYTFVNRAMAELMGCSAADLLGKTPEALFDAEGARTVRAVDDRSFGGEAVSEERDLLIRGETRTLHTIQVPMRDGRDRVVGVCGIVRDVTRRTRAERDLRASQERYLRIVESTHTVIYIVDAEGRITYISPSVETVIGVPPATIIGCHFNDFLHEEEHVASTRSFTSILGGAATHRQEYRVHHRDGSVRWIRAVTEPVANNGRIEGVQGVLWDITDAKQAEEALQEANAALAARTRELEEKNTVLKEVLASIEAEKTAIRAQVEANVRKLVSPVLTRLIRHVPHSLRGELQLLESSIQDIASRFGTALGQPAAPLSPREINIAHMIRNGTSSRQIAKTLGVSVRTVETHRQRIRKKLGIIRQKANLSTVLRQVGKPESG